MSSNVPSRRQSFGLLVLVLISFSVAAPAATQDWPAWRGVDQVGVSDAKDLVSSWSPEGENVIWRQDFIGRSTPLVFDGRVFVQGRAGTEINQRELVAAFDAETGSKLWEYVIPTYLTTVPYNRAGWASLGADRETGYLYAQGVGGYFVCLDRDGKVVWEKSLLEEFGRFSGYGGRTHTPLVDEDQVIISNITGGWGKLGPPRHRYYAFDKKTGAVRWISTPGGGPYDRNTQSNGVIAVINGQRLYISGNADGHIYALKARTGEKVWEFELSKRGINSTPLVVGSTIFVGHSEENIDEAVLGRTIAIDGSGTGDVTKTHELWRKPIKMGFPSPAFLDGRLYVMDNSANLYALDPATGEEHWEISVGTVGKSAPVIADGKIYVTEVNGLVHVIEPGETEAKILDKDEIRMPEDDRYAEVYGSPAIAYGRIYLTSEEGVYSIGDPSKPFSRTPPSTGSLPDEDRGGDKPTVIRVVPAEITVEAGSTTEFAVWAFNEKGRKLGAVEATWSLDGLSGELSGNSLTTGSASQAGELVAKVGDLEARARVRSFSGLPMTEDFSFDGRGRPWWIGAGRYQVTDLDGERVLEKPLAARGLLRSKLFIGPDDWSGYTVQADIRGGLKGRRKTDGGLINSGYILDLLGIKQQLEIRSWTAQLRMAVTIPFTWEMDTWYTMKLRVDQMDGKALVRGKVWKRGEAEPADWTISAEDPWPVLSGSPGLQAYSPASFYFDNVAVTPNE